MATVAHPQRSIGKSDTGRRVWAIVGGSSGNLVEWYDFYFYSFTALYLCAIALIGAISVPDARRQGHLNEEEAKLLEV